MSHPHKHGAPASSSTFPVPLLVVLAIAVILAALLVGWDGHRSPTREQFAQQISVGASADSRLMVTGTLAPLGSFQYRTSPLITRLAVVKRHAADAYLRHEITRNQAAEVQADGDSAYAVIAQATRVCDPAPHTGRCRGPRRRVDELLEQARNVVRAVPDYLPGVYYAAQ